MKEHDAMWQGEGVDAGAAGKEVGSGNEGAIAARAGESATAAIDANALAVFEGPDFDAPHRDETAALRCLLLARKQAGLTQAQVAARMGTTTSAVSRLEASLMRGTHSPSFATLCKYAAACGRRVSISFS